MKSLRVKIPLNYTSLRSTGRDTRYKRGLFIIIYVYINII